MPNEDTRHVGAIGVLIAQYIDWELPQRYSTRLSYLTVLRRWIEPKWGEYGLTEGKAIVVEQWLRTLTLAPKTKTHIRKLMH
ncbi:MAG TPA: hypothetical protein VFP40_11375 [Terriglobales bacterium]|nr:hypothetical protein [Terriglobales bacterium]